MDNKLRRDIDLGGDAGQSGLTASSSTAAPVESLTSENPVVAVVRKANSVVRKHITHSGTQQRSSVRILRGPSSSSILQTRPNLLENGRQNIPEGASGRRRNRSESHRPRWLSIFHADNEVERSNAAGSAPLSTIHEETGRRRLMMPDRIANKLAPHMSLHAEAHGGSQSLAEHFAAHAEGYSVPEKSNTGLLRRAGDGAETAIRWLFGRDKTLDNENHSGVELENTQEEYNSDMVDLLDVVDPEVSALSTLTNVQNSLFIPSLGRLFDRRPMYKFTGHSGHSRILAKLKAPLEAIPATLKDGKEAENRTDPERPPLAHSSTITSTLSESQYAVLPHGETLKGWTPEEKEMLNDLVRHMLHSRRAKLKRSIKGFGQYVRRPLGLFVTVYAFLITMFGAAWVFFLIGWISLGSKRDYVINVVDNVLVALFAIIGDGLAPFRAVDTYHMIYITHYYRKTWSKRKKVGLPELEDHNDLPDRRIEDIDPGADIESLAGQRTSIGGSAGDAPMEYTVLTEKEQTTLEYHQRKFSKSHTFYKPHETETHFAFPIRLLVAIVVLLDFHSMLQISLGACTWGIPYKTRPFALTTVILCCSITCNIMGGVLISVGDHRTRKKDVIERLMRQELTAEAKEHIEKRKIKEAEERGEIDKAERKEAEEEMDEAENEEIKNEWKRVPLLPKKLLGKGEDHREPSLPQKKRRSGIASPSTPTTPTTPATTSKSSVPPVQEGPDKLSQPRATKRTGDEPKQGRKEKIMKMIRKADLDVS